MRTVLAVNPNTHENKEDQNTPTTPSLSLSFSSHPPCPGYFLPQCLQSIFLALCFSIWPLSGCPACLLISVSVNASNYIPSEGISIFTLLWSTPGWCHWLHSLLYWITIFFSCPSYMWWESWRKWSKVLGVLSCIEDTGQRLSSKSSMFLTERELGSIIMETDSLLCGGKLITFLNRQDLKNAFHVFVSLRPDYRKALGIGAN